MFKKFLAALIVMLAASVYAKADSIALSSASNGTYTYSFTQDNVDCGYEWFRSGSQFVLSGLSGITGASTTYPSFFTTTFTSNSATFTLKTLTGFSSMTFRDIFTLTSTVLSTGNGSFSIPDAASATTGALQGPVAVAATPEPSSLFLLGTGLLGIAFLTCRRSRGAALPAAGSFLA